MTKRKAGNLFVGIWGVVFVAALTALIYREIDGPTMRDLSAEVLELRHRVVELSEAGVVQRTLRTYDQALAARAVTELSAEIENLEQSLGTVRNQYWLDWAQVKPLVDAQDP